MRMTMAAGALLLAGTMLSATDASAQYGYGPSYEQRLYAKERRQARLQYWKDRNHAEAQYYKDRAHARALRYKYGYRPYY